MKNFLSRNEELQSSRGLVCLKLFVVLLTAVAGFDCAKSALAQKPAAILYVTELSTRRTGSTTVVSIAADAPLSRAQTWQDGEGFHVVVPEAMASDNLKPEDGIRLRGRMNAVEILIQVKAGTRVSVRASDKRLNLTVHGKLEAGTTDSERANDRQPGKPYPGAGPSDPATPSTGNSERQPRTSDLTLPGETVYAAGSSNHSSEDWPEDNSENRDHSASFFSGTNVLIALVIGIFVFLLVRKVRSFDTWEPLAPRHSAENEAVSQNSVARAGKHGGESLTQDSIRGTLKADGPANGSSKDRQRVAGSSSNAPASASGAHCIHEEVEKLVLGQNHRMDVLSSRVADDRRAIEASLLKVIASPESSADQLRRARAALEEYGFVARLCAAILLSPDAFDRTAAARSLGEIGSAAALPFLLEALHDPEPLVRNQVVVSIGELKMPAAIGALLDMARKHADVPSSVLSRALSACSVDAVDCPGAFAGQESRLGELNEAAEVDLSGSAPASPVKGLTGSTTDEGFSNALAALIGADVNQRIAAINVLGQYRLQSAVAALVLVARMDAEPGLRALAMSSLASIDHESVFPAVLIGLVDPSIEVRTAAARALSRLSFDRSDAYARIIETADEQSLKEVAQACIEAGIVAQNIDRLEKDDTKQAHETFALICLLAKARLTAHAVQAILNRENLNVRLSVIRLLATTGHEDVLEQFRLLAEKDDLPEEVKTALLEAICKLEQALPKPSVQELGVQEAESEQEVGEPAEEHAANRAADDGSQLVGVESQSSGRPSFRIA